MGYRMIRRTAATVAAGLVLSASAAAQSGERARIGDFEIDLTEVTIGQFRAFAEATRLQTAAERTGGGFEWNGGWTKRPGWNVYHPFGKPPASPNEPAVHLTWQEAVAYCRWRGGQLPTAAQWKRAAYTEARERPTGDLATGRTYRYPVGDTADGMNTRSDDPWPLHAPVGSTKRGVNGLYDMGGNVWEWLADHRDDQALTAGGSWWYGAAQTTADGMQWKPADFFAVYVGLRCVYPG
jgi:sulfatase modifying factor 1